MSAPVPARTIPKGVVLQHVSRTVYRGAPLYFGRAGANRYDAPGGSYGVLYLGQDLATALMESLFRKHRWSRAKTRSISISEVNQRLVRLIEVKADLKLADLTASNVMAGRFGLNLAQLSGRRYGPLQAISRKMHEELDVGAPRFDGLYYPSRNNWPSACIALFDRASPKIAVLNDLDLALHRDWPAFVADFRIGVVPV